MKPNDELVELDEQTIGLDRSRITYKGQIQLPGEEKENGDGERSSTRPMVDSPEPRSPTRRMVDSLKSHKHDAGIKIRKSLHVSRASDEIDTSELESSILANGAEEESTSRLVHKLPVPGKHTLKDFVHAPVDTVMLKVSNQGNAVIAQNIAAPEIPHGQEVDLVNAATAAEEATTEKEKSEATEDKSRLMKERQSTYVRWTLDRHITKIRLLPRMTITKKPRSTFEIKNAKGEVVVQWRDYGSHYIGYGSDPPTPSKETIMPNIERLIVATSPLQEIIMTARSVYQWKSPAKTSKYLVIYMLLWYFNSLLAGMLSAILYFVVERRFYGNSIDNLREDIRHREDTERTALSLTEFIEKKGDEEWADEILQSVGPWLMVQLCDMANTFESIRNFYEWRNPTRTRALLCVLALIILTLVLTPAWLLLKATTLSAGFSFFFLFPIATNVPEYRLLASPMKRLLWNIPTHAEWALKHIQAEGTRVKAGRTASPSALALKTSASAVASHDDYGFYKAHFESKAGHLVISRNEVRFVRNVGHVVLFRVRFAEMQRIEKVNRIVKSKVPDALKRDSGQDLKIAGKDGSEWVCVDVDQRDEAFSQVVGFSESVWQIVW